MAVVIETSIGDFTVDLYVKERPKCCLNFLKLCKLKKYTFHLFHTVQTNYVAPSGDPTGTGTGGVSVWGYLGDGKYFDAELRPPIKHNKKGLLSMVSDGNNRHGSQFLITLTDSSDFLDKQNHSVFGEISEGIEVVDKLNDTITDKDDKPYRHIRLFHTVIIDDPFPDPPGLTTLIPDGSPIQAKEQDDDKRVEYNEELDEEKGMTGDQLLERYKEREARTNAKLLEIIGDIPDADIAPPENVLFVCKLNPVTTDEDLEIIFSKFGPIKCCEIIRDYQTDESKGYAFIEFDNVKDCEKAYLKMDNVLIDDRRIHVDFSQSVSKLQWGKHKGFAFWKIKKNKGVVEEAEEDDGPQYNIKDFEKKNTQHYDYVFDDENLGMSEVQVSDGKKKKNKEKKNKEKKSKEKKNKEKKKEKKKEKNHDSSSNHRRRQHHSSSSSSSQNDYNGRSKGNHKKNKKSSDDDDDDSSHGNKRRMRKRHDTTSSDDADDDDGEKEKERKRNADKGERRMRRDDDGGGRRERKRSDDGRMDRRREEERRNERRRDERMSDRRKEDDRMNDRRKEEEKRNERRERERRKEDDRKDDRKDERKCESRRKRRSESSERRDGRKKSHR